tara:strand:+ start:153 stop:836 length:684 start_codon:yes stop_codon:yes gene_type:complete
MAYKQPYKSAILRVDPPDDKIDIYSKKNKSRGRKIAETKSETFKTDKGDLTRDEMKQLANTGFKSSKPSYQIEKRKEKDPVTGFINTSYNKVGYNKIGVDEKYAQSSYSGSKELSRERLSPKEIRNYITAKSKVGADGSVVKGKSSFRQMRDDIKEARPSFKGKGVSKKKKEQWSGIDGKKNTIKNKYGRGRFKMQELEGKGLEKGIGKSPDTKSNQSFCTATGNCT